jgi:hypothetical protein
VSPIIIDRKWTPQVRYAARKFRRDVKKARRRFERAIREGKSEGESRQTLCAEEAKTVLEMLNRLGYGGQKRRAPARQRLELELMVHEKDEDASINFFRLFMAQRKEAPLDQYFSKRGRERTAREAEELRWRHIDELRAALAARNAVHRWLSQYFGRMELAKKYREFARVQFDKSLDNEAKVTYMSLLFAQIAQRTGCQKEEILEEYNEMVQTLGLDVGSGEIDMDGLKGLTGPVGPEDEGDEES